MNYAEESLRLHGEWKGKIEVISRVPVQNKDDLSLAYTPGVAQPCLEIQKDYNKYFTLTRRKIVSKTVEHKMLDDNIGYIAISSFDMTTYNDLLHRLYQKPGT